MSAGVTIVDIGISNIGSVVQAFQHLGVDVGVSRRKADIESAEALVLPGVGAFADGMESLREANLVECLRKAAITGVPLLGFCLGLQLLMDESEEHGRHEGLGLVPGNVKRLPEGSEDRVPNMGWCDVHPRSDARLFRSTAQRESFYFVHSYVAEPQRPEDTAATIEFNCTRVTVAVEAGNVFGLQFHPEKSQDAGLVVLNEFLTIVREHRVAAA